MSENLLLEFSQIYSSESEEIGAVCSCAVLKTNKQTNNLQLQNNASTEEMVLPRNTWR